MQTMIKVLQNEADFIVVP